MSTVWDFTVTRTDWRDGCTTKSINTRKLPKTLAESKKESYEKNRKRMSERTKRKRKKNGAHHVVVLSLGEHDNVVWGELVPEGINGRVICEARNGDHLLSWGLKEEEERERKR